MSTLGIMATGGDPLALGQLLRSRRERLAPGDVGLPVGQRRRTAGLRREEVALLASLSITYYTFLEQGRPVRPSAQVLDALAAALRMSGFTPNSSCTTITPVGATSATGRATYPGNEVPSETGIKASMTTIKGPAQSGNQSRLLLVLA